MRYFWLPFLFLPLAEMLAFIAVAKSIGLVLALALCIAMAFVGTWLVQRQGMENFMRAQQAMRDGKMPFRDMFNGLCIVIAGFLFIFPGFISDILALLLLLPEIRARLRAFLAPRMETVPGDPGVIEGEFTRVDPPPSDRLHP